MTRNPSIGWSRSPDRTTSSSRPEPVAVHDVARRAWVAIDTGDARLVTRAANNRVLEADKARLRELPNRC